MPRQNLLFLQGNTTWYFYCEELRENFSYNFLATPNIFSTSSMHSQCTVSFPEIPAVTKRPDLLDSMIPEGPFQLRYSMILWFFKIKADSSIFTLIIVHDLFFLLNCFYFAMIMGIFLITELTCVFLHYGKPEIYPSGNAALVKKEKIKPNLGGEGEKKKEKRNQGEGAHIHHYHCKKHKTAISIKTIEINLSWPLFTRVRIPQEKNKMF